MTRHAPTNTTRIRRATRRGFTIVELLVAVSLLALMLFLIDNLFNSTTRAVSDGVRQSAVLANARAVQSRLTIDASAMLGPNANNPAPEGGGYLVIINHRIQAQVRRRDGSESLETFRVDQLVYMASTTVATSNIRQFRASAPRDETQFGSDYTSPYALIRYSHGRRTNRDGSDIAGWVELGWDRSSGLDRLANDWILTRQAVLFNPTDGLGNTIEQNGFSDWFVDTPRVGELVQGKIGLTHEMYVGYCDVTARPASAPLTAPLPGFVDMRLDPSNPGLNATDIENNYLFLTHIDQRLRVNPIPASTNFESEPVGQLHGIFAPNCSEFIVQFAADANNDGEIDRVGPTGLNDGTEADGDEIYWYDFDALAQLGADPWAGTEWTGSTVPSPVVDLSPTGRNSAYGSTAFIFRYEDDQAYTETTPGNGDVDNSKWPYMIRIRYRLHDAPGRLESNASFRRADGFSNDDDNNDGTVNGAGDIADEEDEAIVSGRYFEQIIRVPRP